MASTALNKGTIKVTLEGRGAVTLRPTDYITTGGEGSIYRVSDLVVKLFSDPKKMRDRGTVEKLRRLARFTHPYVVSPRGLALDVSGNPVGYYMPYVEEPPAGYPLSVVFTNDFYQLTGFNPRRASTLVDRMRETVMFGHAEGATLIDPNELNWFAVSVNKDPEPRIVDVDSWVLGPMPPKVAVMPSIRDWHHKHFDQMSDWFSWGVVTFQVYTGIHPYKGTLDGYARGDLEQRMKDNASVFMPGVRLNRAVRDFSSIPGLLLNWYEATFQKGERTKPPSPFDTGIAMPAAAKVLRTVITASSGALIFEKILGYAGDPVLRIFHCGVALLSSGQLIDLATKRTIARDASSSSEIIKTESGWVVGDVVNKEAVFRHVAESNLGVHESPLRLKAQRLLGYENRMFAVGENGLMELKVTNFGSKAIVSTGKIWNILSSTKWFNGLGVLDAMGAKFVVSPFGADSVAQVRVRELDNLQVVAGKAGSRFASVICVTKTGDYRKVEFTFDRDYRSYQIWEGSVDNPELNLAVLPKGVCATIVTDGELTIFVPSNGAVNKVSDKHIATDMLLANWEDKVSYIHNGDAWSLRMK